MTKEKSWEGWKQIDGDINPGLHGAVIAKWERDRIMIREIIPVLGNMSKDEAKEWGCPFASKIAEYYFEDLVLENGWVITAFESCGVGLEIEDSHSEQQVTIALALFRYGYKVEEGPFGWAISVCPGVVQWWAGSQDWQMLAEGDQKFWKAMQK